MRYFIEWERWFSLSSDPDDYILIPARLLQAVFERYPEKAIALFAAYREMLLGNLAESQKILESRQINYEILLRQAFNGADIVRGDGHCLVFPRTLPLLFRTSKEIRAPDASLLWMALCAGDKDFPSKIRAKKFENITIQGRDDIFRLLGVLSLKLASQGEDPVILPLSPEKAESPHPVLSDSMEKKTREYDELTVFFWKNRDIEEIPLSTLREWRKYWREIEEKTRLGTDEIKDALTCLFDIYPPKKVPLPWSASKRNPEWNLASLLLEARQKNQLWQV